MSLELQVRVRVVVDAMTLAVQRRLRSDCVGPQGGAHLDHIDVDVAGAKVVNDAGTIVVQLPMDVFVVDDAALLAAPNAAPAGAVAPTTRVIAEHELAAEVVGGVPQITFKARPVTGLPPGVSAPAPLDPIALDGMIAQLKARSPLSATTALVDDVVVFRFDASGPPVAHLPPDDGWGLFLSGDEWERMIFPQLVAAAHDQVPMVVVQPRWRPAGALPRVEFTGTFELAVETPAFKGDVQALVHVACEFRMVPLAGLVRVTVRWSDLELAGVPQPLTDLILPLVEDRIRPQAFGAAPAGHRAFSIDVAFTPPPLFGARLTTDALIAAPQGATLSGDVVLVHPAHDAFGVDISPLSLPTRIQLCSQGGVRDRTPLTIDNAATYGSATFKGAGRLCGYEPVTPPAAAPYVRVVPGADDDAFEIRARMPYAEALKLEEPLRFVARTTRGVRLIDLGVAPPATFDEEGRLVGNDWWIPNCLYVDHELTGWASAKNPLDDHRLRVDLLKPPPLEHPDWTRFVAAGHGVSVQLVTLTELDPGEFVRFRSTTHDVAAVADASGAIELPVVVPLGDAIDLGLIERAGRRSLEGHVRVASADFEHRLVLPPAPGEPLAIGDGHRAAVVEAGVDTTTIDVHDDGGRRVRIVAGHNGNAAALNPQPLPPSPDTVREQLGLEGVVDVIPVPGFEGAASSIAVLDDGSQLLLEARDGRALRVAGTFRGPIGRIALDGGWAVAADARRAVVLAHA